MESFVDTRFTAVAFAIALGLGTFATINATAAAAPVAAANCPGACGLPDFTGLVEKVGPSVVNIRTFKRISADQGPQMDDQTREFLRRFFGVPVPPTTPPGGGSAPRGEDEEKPTGVGSGFILSADGYVMTNAHVVDGADEIMVTLTDKREFKAKLIGADKRTDIAVVKIDAKNLPAVNIGDSKKIKVGEWVVAIGSPFGLENTVTAGIVSAKGRDTGDYTPFIQTDVAVNPGNSGGPLINMQGQVIGINSQIYSRTGGFMGISFAIPIDEAIRVADQLKATGYVVRGKIGVAIDSVSRELAESIGLGKPMGALVRSVEAGGAADKAGVQAGDIVTKFDGKTIERATDLPRIVGEIKPGTRVPMQVFRRGTERTLQVSVSEWAKDTKAASEKPKHAHKSGAEKSPIGVAAVDLNDTQKKELGVKSGVLVEAVQGPAGRDGLRVGDVVTTMNNVEITSAKQFKDLAAALPTGKPVALLVRRGDAAQFILVRPKATGE
ncbi:MAG: DegQ family serine endoprotease [Burkholderiales bacterium]|nr:DegQ family serine endoprotease [Burkholderiales bacterium]